MPEICFFWLTMGSYHYARMNALVKAGLNLRVVELTDKDDHFWELKEEALFEHVTLHHELLSDELLTKNIDQVISSMNLPAADIIVNGAGFFNLKFNFALSRASKEQGTQLFLWSESTVYDNPSGLLKKLAKRYALTAYDASLVAGKRHRAYLEKHGMKSDVIYEVGNVVNNKSFEPSEEVIKKARRNFLFVGRLLTIKGVELLLYSFARYRDLCELHKMLPWELTICGDGPEMKYLKGIAQKLEIDDYVYFKGNVQPDQIRQEYLDHAVFILPSLSEPWGLVVNEAMAASLPVIVSEHCGCVPELVHESDNGFRFIPDRENPQILAELMLRIHKDPDLRSYMASQSSKIIKEFTPEKYAAKCKEAFLDILDKSE